MKIFTEVCNRCDGKGFVSDRGFCESCGGYGTNDWVGNAIGKPDKKPIFDIVHDILSNFIYELNNKETIVMMNNVLNKFFDYHTELKYKVIVRSISDLGEFDVRIIEKERNNEI